MDKRYNSKEEYLGFHKKINNLKPLLSVCIQTYQHVNYIEECIEGVLLQKTNFPVEIIIGEDASTDGTREICIKYANENQDKIRLFLRDRETSQVYDDKGVFITRFNGKWTRKSATGKYIAICEGDDYWTDPLKLQKQVDFLEANEDYGLVYTDFEENLDNNITNRNSIQKNLQKRAETGYVFFPLLKGNFIQTLTVCFRSDLLKFLDLNLKTYTYDYWYWLMISQLSKIKHLKDTTGIYRIHGSSLISKGGHVQSRSALVMQDAILTFLENNDFRKLNVDEKDLIVWPLFKVCVNTKIPFSQKASSLSFFLKNPFLLFKIIKLTFLKLKKQTPV